MPLDLSTPPRPSSFLQLIRASLVLVDGSIMCRANTTCSPKRALRCRHRLTLLSLTQTLCSVSTLRSAIELKAVFDQIQQAEQSGSLSPEEKKRLEEQAAEKGLHALFKVRSFLFHFSPRTSFNRCVRNIVHHKTGRETGDRIGAARDVRPGVERPDDIEQYGDPARGRVADPRECVHGRAE